MFDIFKREYKDPLLGLKYVGDPDRLVTLQRIAGLAHRPGAAFKMTAGDAVIPFEVTSDLLTDPETGQEFVLRRFESFGASPTAKLLGQIEPYEFSDEETRARFLLLAAEALIVFGWSYDGFSQDEGFIRVDVGGRTLTLRDIAHP